MSVNGVRVVNSVASGIAPCGTIGMGENVETLDSKSSWREIIRHGSGPVMDGGIGPPGKAIAAEN
jgi:hypothetical protein